MVVLRITARHLTSWNDVKEHVYGEMVFPSVKEAKWELDSMGTIFYRSNSDMPNSGIASDYEVNAKIYEDGELVTYRSGQYFTSQFFEYFGKYFSDEGLERVKKEKRKRRIIKNTWRAVGFAFVVCLCYSLVHFVGGMRDLNDHNKEMTKATWDSEMVKYDNETANASLRHDVVLDDGSVLPQWQNYEGDTARCRKEFLERMKVMYSQERYNRSTTKIEAEIKGDTLCLYSSSFKEETAAQIAQNDLYQYITDCDFAKVVALEGTYGGAHGWVIYHRGDMMDEIIDEEVPEIVHNLKTEKITLWDIITFKDNEKTNRNNELFRKAMDEHKKEVKAREDKYRRDFIARKDSLYKARAKKLN